MELFESIISVDGNQLSTIGINENTSTNLQPPRITYYMNVNTPFLTIDPRHLNTKRISQLGRTPLMMSNYIRRGYTPINVRAYNERESCTLENYLLFFSRITSMHTKRYVRVVHEHDRVWILSSTDRNINSVDVSVVKDVIDDHAYYTPMIKGSIDTETTIAEVMHHDITLDIRAKTAFTVLNNFITGTLNTTYCKTISQIFQYSGHLNCPLSVKLIPRNDIHVFISGFYSTGCSVELTTHITDTMSNMKFLSKINDLFDVADTCIGLDSNNRQYIKCKMVPSGDTEKIQKYFNIMQLNGCTDTDAILHVFL